MMHLNQRLPFALCALVLWLPMQPAQAEPYLATRMGLKCVACHVNPTGGGLRNDYGIAFASTVLPAQPLSGDAPHWTGRISDLIRLGGDLRASAINLSVPHTPDQHQVGLDQIRVYGDLSLIPQRLGLYVDEQVGPGAAQNMEAYVRYGDTAKGWYLKGGKFYVPFGWRLQDSAAFVRILSRISMAAPDSGVELGYEAPQWSAQFDLTNVAGNGLTRSGYQTTGQMVWVQSRWRLGTAASFTRADAGNRRALGLFAGARTGPVVWLAEADLMRDENFSDGAHSQVATLAEADWEIRRGHNLKLTAERMNDRDVGGDAQNRWSVLYELMPLPFVQLRAGYRRLEGRPEVDIQNRRFTFIELHGFF